MRRRLSKRPYAVRAGFRLGTRRGMSGRVRQTVAAAPRHHEPDLVGHGRQWRAVSSFRESVERGSGPLLERLATLPRALPFLVVLVLLVEGLVVPGWGWALLAVGVAFLGWLLYLGWPRLTMPERLLRIAVLAFFAAVTITRALPR